MYVTLLKRIIYPLLQIFLSLETFYQQESFGGGRRQRTANMNMIFDLCNFIVMYCINNKAE